MKVLNIVILISFSLIVSFLNELSAQAPEGAIFPIEKIMLGKTPEGYPVVSARCDVASLKNDNKPNDGYILVDYMKVIEEDLVTGIKTVIVAEHFQGTGPLNTHQGGLYDRNPRWYSSNDFEPLTISRKENGMLTIAVGQRPDRISHFWTKWAESKLNARHYVEIRILISGDIGFQIGLDYCNNRGNCHQVGTHQEAFVSNWCGDTNGEYITLRYPDYENRAKFGREHYGFTPDGIFYFSKELADFLKANHIELKSGATSWQPEQMELKGKYYIYDINFPLHNNALYCFRLNHSDAFHIPDANRDIFIFQEDIRPNTNGGANFLSLPNEAIIFD